MNSVDQTALPAGWRWAELESVAPVNPRRRLPQLNDDDEVAFVGMACVEAETGRIDVSTRRRVDKVKQGFTRFIEGDLLFAKITPCMENGKIAIAPPLPHFVGFGSTEFHVLAPQKVLPRFLYYWLSQRSFREAAEFKMTGTAGQKRVPPDFLRNSAIPLPPTEAQRRIVTRIDDLFTEIDDGEAALARARSDLATWRKSLLKAAVTGDLTADWRAASPATETGADLLARILAERRQRWEAEPKNKGKRYVEPAPPRLEELPGLPSGWIWASFEQLIDGLRNGLSVKPGRESPGIPILRISAVRAMEVTASDCRWLPQEFDVGRSNATSGDLLFTRYNGSADLVGVVRPPAFRCADSFS